MLSSSIEIAHQQLILEDLFPLPESHTKATLFYEPCIVQSQWLFWVDQFDLYIRVISAQTHRDMKGSGQRDLNLLQTF